MRIGWAVVLGSVALAGSQSAAARDVPKGPPPPQVQTLLDCRSISDDAARLACFDKSAAVIGDAVSKRDLVVFDREAVRKTKRGLFGFSIPNLGIFGDDNDEVELKQLDGEIAALGRNSDGGYVFKLADGTRWTQMDGKPIALEPQIGDKVVVRRGALGSYMMSVARQPGVKVKRLS